MNEINILLLGETGVGKSTFINALLNYLTYNKLTDALKKDLLSVIPASFVVTDKETFQRKTVSIGYDSNEVWTTGQSSTQSCRSYNFQFDEHTTVRIIDTPGIGDTRGIDEDVKNFQNIMTCISNYDHLNGICLLLKPNQSRLTVFFRFCIKELLKHLHRSAVDNIVFCFTNARSTFYRPGDTGELLAALLSELKGQTGVEVPFTRSNTFAFDNESFRFVVAHKQGIRFDDNEKDDYVKSWDTSVEQSLKLILYIANRPPHRVRETLSLNEVRRLIYELTRPIAEIAHNIQVNITVSQEKMAELNSTEGSIADLGKKLKIPAIDLESTPLPYPRTVCTASRCTKYIKFDDQIKIDYNTHCHEHCYLQGVAQNVVNNSALQRCSAMKGKDVCSHCSCSWNTHMHISYETKQVRKETIDRSIEEQIKTKEGRAQAIRQTKQDLERRINNFVQEQATLTSACAKLSKFLHENSITPYNDDLIKYVEHLLREEEEKRSAGANNQNTIDGLRNMINAYQHEIDIYKNMLKSSQTNHPGSAPNLEEIQRLINSLYNLPYSGPLLKQQINIIRQGQTTATHRYEITCTPPQNKSYLARLKSFGGKYFS